MTSHPTYVEADPFALARRIKTPIWVYDTDHQRIAFANKAACELWGAETEACLQSRDLSKGMSKTVSERLAQYQIDFLMRDAQFNETWTLYPNDIPTTVNVIFSGFEMLDGGMAMMCEVAGQTIQKTETLRSTKALLHTDVNIALFSHDGRPLYKNTAARSILPNDTRLEQLFLVPEDYKDSQAIWEKGEESRRITKIKTSDGDKWFDLRVKQCLDPTEGEKALLITAVDVSELKKAETTMQAAKEAAESANLAKSEFLANMSHEIRTPMNGVLGMVDVLSQSKLDAQQQRCIDIISKSGENLLRIINDILDFSKIEAGRIALDPKRCNLKECIQNSVRLFSAMAAEKNLTLSFDYPKNLPMYFLADSTRIQQIISNLIGNAIKFTHSGSVTVRVDGAPKNAAYQLNIAVVDSGIGIAKSKIDTIFEKFSQAESSTTRNYGGTGLGLAISKKLALIMKGSLDISSKLGQGSTFTLKLALPLAEVATPKPYLAGKNEVKRKKSQSPSNEKAKIQRSGKKLNVLIVEDNEINKMVLSSFLKNPRINLSYAENGRVAVKMCKTQNFDMIFMDVSMPVMGGIEATQKIRANEEQAKQARTPIICLSAHVAADDRHKFLQAGMDDYLSKPLIRNELYAILSKWLQQSKSTRGETSRAAKGLTS